MMGIRRIAAVASALVLLPTLAACSLVESAVEQSVNDAMQGASDAARSTLEDVTGVDVEGGDEIPADFPAGIPLVDGEVTTGNSLSVNGKTTFTVTIETDAAVADVFAQARTLLSDAGYEQSFASETAEQSIASYSGEYTVLLTVSVVADRTAVNYVVTPVGAQ